MRVLFLLLFFTANEFVLADELLNLKVSDNQRFLVTEDGQPFFWQGDTAWELFHRANREQATTYLDQRKSVGFTVVQAVAIAELNGHADPNPYGHLPFIEFDPARPYVKDGPENDYWDHVDWIVDEANKRGIYMGFLPTWGVFWHEPTHNGKVIFNPENARIYGKWLGQRYRNKSLVWILGGDRTVDNDEHRAILNAMAAGITEGDDGKHLMTFHPRGGRSSSEDFHQAEWLDFNMCQNGHNLEYQGSFSRTLEDYNLKPTKPVIDGEPIYEDHPISFRAQDLGHSVGADTRRPLYWDLFNGAFGHTYGHHSVWQMYQPPRGPINNPLMPWYDAINQPGAAQLQHAKRLLMSRPYLTRIPADDMIVGTDIPSAMPGTGARHFAATRDSDKTYAFVYAPVGRSFTVNLDTLGRDLVNLWWYDPRTGNAELLEKNASGKGQRSLNTPTPGELLDWVLVIDDAAAGYNAPGK